MSNNKVVSNTEDEGEASPVVSERVFFVVKKVVRRQAIYAVAEHGLHCPEGFYEVLNTRTIHMGSAIKRKKDLTKRDSRRGR